MKSIKQIIEKLEEEIKWAKTIYQEAKMVGDKEEEIFADGYKTAIDTIFEFCEEDEK